MQPQHRVHLCRIGKRNPLEPEVESEMTMAYANAHTSRRPVPVIAGIVDAVAALRAAWDRSRVYMRTYNELSALSTRELADLGISRSMISRLAYEAAYSRDA